jgi:hypothetical protein
MSQNAYIPTNQIRIEISPSREFIKHYCQVESLGVPRIFFERFLDDENFTLLRQNYWLRERLHDREANPYKLILSHVYEEPHPKLMKVLFCRQWKTEEAIDSELEKIGRKFSSFGCMTGYNVFRYDISPNCTLDQAVFDTSNIENRHETLSIRFSDRKSLEEFVLEFGDHLTPNYSKVIVCLYQENPEVLRKLGIKVKIPRIHSTFPKPNVSRMNIFQE